VKRLLALSFLLLAAPAAAQRTEVSALAGYTTSADIDKKAAGIQELRLDGGFTWGLAVARFFSPNIGAELSWAQHESPLVLGTSAGSAELFDTSIGQLQGSLVYQLGADGARVRPFLSAGLGAAILSARDLDTETKLSFGFGAGLKWFLRNDLGVRIQARYSPIRLGDSSSDFCDPFGFCQDSLSQLEVTGGVAWRF
jgi:opacity protein-like surface antigen